MAVSCPNPSGTAIRQEVGPPESSERREAQYCRDAAAQKKKREKAEAALSKLNGSHGEAEAKAQKAARLADQFRKAADEAVSVQATLASRRPCVVLTSLLVSNLLLVGRAQHAIHSKYSYNTYEYRARAFTTEPGAPPRK